MPKPYTLKQYGNRIVREYSEGLPDKTLKDFWVGERRKLTSDEQQELSAYEWTKYYFWLSSHLNSKRLLK